MLTCTGLSNQAGLTHALSQQSLAQHVIDLVATGVVQVLALEEDAGTGVLRELRNLGQQRRTVRVLGGEALELGQEFGVVLRLVKGGFQLIHGGNQRLGHPPPAVLTKVGAGGVLQRLTVEESICQVFAHHYSFPGWLMPDARISRARGGGGGASGLNGASPAGVYGFSRAVLRNARKKSEMLKESVPAGVHP